VLDSAVIEVADGLSIDGFAVTTGYFWEDINTVLEEKRRRKKERKKMCCVLEMKCTAKVLTLSRIARPNSLNQDRILRIKALSDLVFEDLDVGIQVSAEVVLKCALGAVATIEPYYIW